MDVAFNERTKCAAEISPGWSAAEPWVAPVRSKARFSGRKTSLRETLLSPSKAGSLSFSVPYPGLRCACPGLNSAAGYGGSLSRFFLSTAPQSRFRIILGPVPEGGQ